MADANPITVPAAGKLSNEQTGTFMSRLLGPLPEGIPLDRELARLEQKARAEERQRMLHAWVKGMKYVEIAAANLELARCNSWLVTNKTGFVLSETPVTREDRIEEAALREWHKAVAAQILIPAPNATKLRWKLNQYCIRYGKQTPEMAAAISADEARLGRR